ncbi:hypothetical protein FB446DRAFT_791294 [Lentinula raphanica]|nr:hypothetical protein FB446DRAFT_791294 [Lentinula raphanica]
MTTITAFAPSLAYHYQKKNSLKTHRDLANTFFSPHKPWWFFDTRSSSSSPFRIALSSSAGPVNKVHILTKSFLHSTTRNVCYPFLDTMRTYNTLVPFVTLALTLAANAAPTPSPSNERGYAQTAVARGVFDVPVEARGVVDVPPAGADLSRRTEGQTPSSSFTSSIYRRHQEPTEGTHRITEYYAPEKKPKSGEFENANQHHSGGPPGVNNPQHHQNGVTPPEGNSGNRPPHEGNRPPHHEGNPTPPGSPLANEKYEGHRPPHHEGYPTPPGSPLANEREVDKKHEGNHPGDEQHEGNEAGKPKGVMGKAKNAIQGKTQQLSNYWNSDKGKQLSHDMKVGAGAGAAGILAGGALVGSLAYVAGSSSSGQTGTGATSTGEPGGGGVAGSANMDMTAGGATGTSDGSMGMGDGSMGTGTGDASMGTGTSDGSMGTGTGTGTGMDQSGMMRKRDLIRSLHHRRVTRWDLD